ncbi:MAG: phosphoribosyl-ATP pyrophosphatase [Gloeocapsa sp. DLM2.Bin57]|nr:MAG: phosphoribosyl-ATP pyrophosphatase [Gloeocapsa sp. DLM2.Bin57]
MAKAYDYWDIVTRENYNPDGTMKESYRNRLIARGCDFFKTLHMEMQKIKEVEEFEKMEEKFKEIGGGQTYSEFLDKSSNKESISQQNRRQQEALREGAEISELPYDIDPDDYYNYYSSYTY